MPTPVPPDYPYGLSNEKLRELLDAMLRRANGWSESFDRILPELQLAVIQLGLQEQARRDNSKTGRLSLAIAALALLVSIASLIVTAAG